MSVFSSFSRGGAQAEQKTATSTAQVQLQDSLDNQQRPLLIAISDLIHAHTKATASAECSQGTVVTITHPLATRKQLLV